MRPVRRVPVESTSVKSVGYDPDTGTMEVEFVSGAVYEYLGVPPKVHRELVGAESIGGYFTQYVRDRYFTQKVG